MMVWLAVICFAIAAVLGLLLLTYVIRKKPTPKGLALIHGPFAVLGVILLIIGSFQGKLYFLFPVAIFLVAAVFGLAVFYKDITREKPPRTLAVVHGVIAVFAFLIVLSLILIK